MDLWDWLNWLVRTVSDLTLVRMGDPEDALVLRALKPITDRETALAAHDAVVELQSRWEGQKEPSTNQKRPRAKRQDDGETGEPFFFLNRVHQALDLRVGRWWWFLPHLMQEAAVSALAAGIEAGSVNYTALVVQAGGWERTHQQLMDTARAVAALESVAQEQALRLISRGWFDNRAFTLETLIATATAAVSGS
jgi:hypothetical protein